VAAALIFFSSCAEPDFPDTDLCVVNAPGQRQKCYNLKNDYTKEGYLKSDAKPKYKPAVTVEDLNKNVCTDVPGFTNLKAFMKDLRENYRVVKK